MEREHILQLAKDMIMNHIPGEYSDDNTNSEALREAFIEANGGQMIDIKHFHPGNVCYDIIQELVPTIVHERFSGNEFIFNLVDYRNIALGDDIEFYAEDKSEFIVSDLSYGTSGIRRQRLGEGDKYTVETKLKGIKIYDEFKRFLAKRVDFNKFTEAVAKSMLDRLNEDIYNAFRGVTDQTSGLSSEYVISGTADEDEVLELIEHVSAANNNSNVIVLGTRKALRKLKTATISDQAKNDMYKMGYYGKFNGTDCVYMPQRHKAGTNQFLFDDDKLFIIPVGVDKPIKVVNVGVGYIFDRTMGNPVTGDLTLNYTYAQEYGVAIVFSTKMGFYTVTQ